ncbi:MAG: F0F1 ATP synthase subunit A [Anaerolineales bacterium]
MTTTQPRRIGFKRWIVTALIVLGAILGYGLFGVSPIFKPIAPAVVLPAEAIWPGLNILPGLPFTNTLLATLIADVIVLLLGFTAWRFVSSGKLVPSGLYHIVELLVEFLWNTTESTAGKWAKRIFPIMATIFLLVLVSNVIDLIPGFESIGYLEPAHGSVKGYAPVEIANGVYALDGSHVVTAEHVGEGAAAEEGLCTACTVVPFLRGAATDLNFTFALAVIAVIAIQVFGVWALGARYFGKFFNTGGMINKPIFGVIDFGVGLLEIVSEISKILSFGFRLFGNIFAGALLLSILGSLTVVIVPSMLYVLELFVGAIQAYVFSMLALVFISQAVVSHHGDDHAEPAAAPAH